MMPQPQVRLRATMEPLRDYLHDQAEGRGTGEEEQCLHCSQHQQKPLKEKIKHELNDPVAQFESMATSLFMDSLIDFFNDT